MMPYLVADSIMKGKEIPLYEGGQMYRDWTYVDDITDGVTVAIDRPLGYEVINLGRGEPTLLKDFVRMIEDLAGNNANLIAKPKPAADVTTTFADISKAAALLDYDPKVPVAEGVAAFWQWYVENAKL
jgi:UDP-glucuronate 4-epimerase